jgi:triosephosphate isomerase
MRKPFICGNWKMNKTIAQTGQFVADLLPLIAGVKDVDVGFAPPASALAPAVDFLIGTDLLLGAQNVHWEKSGAFTGELSCEMLDEIGCDFVLVGHSERRQYFGETDETVGLRAVAALQAGITPVICIGELLEERDRGEELAVVERQLRVAYENISDQSAANTVVAYEPVWAIGTGRTATADEAQRMHSHIRDVLAKRYRDIVSQQIRILYGGSVKPENVVEIMQGADVDGALVGGASLSAETFASLVRFRV